MRPLRCSSSTDSTGSRSAAGSARCAEGSGPRRPRRWRQERTGVRRIVERLLHAVALDHPSMPPQPKRQDPLVLVALAQPAHEVVERRLVLGEDDEPLVVAPSAIRRAGAARSGRHSASKRASRDRVLLSMSVRRGGRSPAGEGRVDRGDLGRQVAGDGLEPGADDAAAVAFARLRSRGRRRCPARRRVGRSRRRPRSPAAPRPGPLCSAATTRRRPSGSSAGACQGSRPRRCRRVGDGLRPR